MRAWLRLAATVTILASATTLGRAAEPYAINVVLPLTGGAAFLGKAEQQALERYEKLVTETGGIHGKPLKFIYHDDQSSPQISVQLVNQIKSSNPPVILGSAISGVCNAMAPLVRRGPVMYCFSPSIDPQAGGFVFSSSISTLALADGLLRFFGGKGLKRIALITSTDATGQDAFRNVKALMASEAHKGLELVAETQFNPTDVSVAAQVQRLKSANPDAVIAWATGSPFGTVLKGIKDAGLTVPVGTTDGNMTYAQMAQYAAFMPTELYIPSPEWMESPRLDQNLAVNAAKKAFFKAFEGASIKPDGPSTFAWDPALLVVEALRKSKPDASAEDVRNYLTNLQGFAGINGIYDFKAVPNRGVDSSNVVVTRWDQNVGTWVVASQLLGAPLAK